jgi:hypothetical protein
VADCTLHIPRARITATVAVILALCCGAVAKADGDPASDVLASQSLFLAQDAGASAAQQTELGALLRSAGRSGYQLRVAVIASPSDLGSVTALWRQPEAYARFLGEELALVYRGPLLVVMPNGYGLARLGQPLSAVRAALPPTAGGTQLAQAALTSIERLAAASGHVLPEAPSAAPLAPGSGSIGPVSWLVLGAGAALIAAAWTASLRARPLRDGLL